MRDDAVGRDQLPVGAGGFLCSRGYAPELARGIRLALEHPAAAGEVFNLCEAQCAPLRLWIAAKSSSDASGSGSSCEAARSASRSWDLRTLRLVRTVIVVSLVIGALLATAVGVLVLAVHGGTCSPHEGGSGCGFKIVLAIPWIVALGLAGGAIAATTRRR